MDTTTWMLEAVTHLIKSDFFLKHVHFQEVPGSNSVNNGSSYNVDQIYVHNRTGEKE